MSLDTPKTTDRLEWVGLWLEPLDVLFFRDGRPFGAAMRAQTGQPMPQTLAGAIWTALLRQAGCHFPTLISVHRSHQKQQASRGPEGPKSPHAFGVRNDLALREAIRQAGGPEWIFQVQVRGPWLARQDRTRSSASPGTVPDTLTEFRYPELVRSGKSQALEVLVPVPAVLYTPKGKKEGSGDRELLYANPLPTSQTPPGWKPPIEGLRPVWIKTREDMELVRGYLTLEGLWRILQGQVPTKEQLVPEEKLFDYDHRTGIQIEMDRLTSEESQIYAISLLALQKGVGFYAEVGLPPEGATMLRQIPCLQWGGEGRNVLLEQVQQLCQWPKGEPTNGLKPFLVLTTPGLFDRGWCPGVLADHLAAAAVPGEVAVSGWDLARGGPKPARFAAAPGSVYFLHQLPENLSDALSDQEEDRQQGWGCYVQGVWTYE